MLKEYRSKAQGVPDLLNYAMMVREGTVLLKDGAFLAGWAYRGPDLNSSANEELEFLSASINNVISQLGNGWMAHIDMVRSSSQGYSPADDNHFPDIVSRMIDEERRIQYEAEGVHFESTYTILITYLPPVEIEAKVTKLFVDDETAKAHVNWNTLLHVFEEKIRNIENVLSKILTLSKLDSDALLTFLHQCITGLAHPIYKPTIPVYLDTVLGTQDLIGGMQPKIGNHYLRVINIEGLPHNSEPGILDVLSKLPLAFRWSNRFIFLDPQSAVAELTKYRRNWFQKRNGLMSLVKEVMSGEADSSVQNRDALDMAEDVDQAIQTAESGLVRFGYYTSVVILYEEDKNQLDISTKILYEELCNRGFTLRVETVNAMEAYIGSLPGHGYQNIRRPLIHSLNLADIIPLTSVWAGLEKNPCKYFPKNSPPLLYAATEGATPCRINLHVNDVAHTLIFGTTGDGKSTLVCTLAAQFRRYKDAQVFIFDKGYSSYVLCKALGGTHYDILSSNKSPAFYPLEYIHEPTELDWACEWIEECLTANNFTVNNRHRNIIREGLIRLSHSKSRTLTELQGTIQDKDIQRALEFYTLAGEMGSVLDSNRDDLREGNFQVFEMEHLIRKGEARLKPTILYLFHQIEKRISENKPTLIFVEEGHNFTTGKFGEQLDRWVLEIRKKNAGLVFLTQDPSHVLKTEHKENLFNNCYTKIYTPNKQSDNEINSANYRAVGLTNKQIDIIKNAIPKKNYYITSRLGNRLVDLGLGELALSFVAIDGETDRNRVDELSQKYGDYWIYYWLKERELPEWANFWKNAYEKSQLLLSKGPNLHG